MKKKIIIAVVVVLVICICALSIFFIYKYKQKLKPALLKSATMYEIDYETNEWKKKTTKEYEYENNYPISIKTIENEGENEKTDTLEYEFNNNTVKSMKKYNNNGVLEFGAEYSNGKIMRIDAWSEDKTIKKSTFFQYEEENEDYFNLVLHASHKNSENQEENSNFDEVNTISIFTKNGLLNKTINKGLYTKTNEDGSIEWVRFNGTYTVNYDENGILSSTESIYKDNHPTDRFKYEAKIENEKVVEVIKYKWSSNDETWQKEQKVVFDYNDTSIDSKRYATMINAHIIEEDNNFYIYRWY